MMTRLEKFSRDKHSSLYRKFVNYGVKKFYNIGPRVFVPGKPFQPNLLFVGEAKNLP